MRWQWRQNFKYGWRINPRRKAISLFQWTICLSLCLKWAAASTMWKHVFLGFFLASWEFRGNDAAQHSECYSGRQSGSRCSPDISNYSSNPHLGSVLFDLKGVPSPDSPASPEPEDWPHLEIWICDESVFHKGFSSSTVTWRLPLFLSTCSPWLCLTWHSDILWIWTLTLKTRRVFAFITGGSCWHMWSVLPLIRRCTVTTPGPSVQCRWGINAAFLHGQTSALNS